MTDSDIPRENRTGTRRAAVGLPLTAIVALALLGVPRVILHDLDVIEEGTAVNAALVFVPPLIWIAAALWRRVPNPFLTLLAIGACYGIFLALGHQLLWDQSFGGEPPRLGGNLEDLDPTLETVILRTFAALSSVFTGLMVGAIAGLAAWGVAAVTGRNR